MDIALIRELFANCIQASKHLGTDAGVLARRARVAGTARRRRRCLHRLEPRLGHLEFLPALPKAWADGHVKGLRARGNVEVDVAWARGRATQAELRPKLSGEFALRAPKGQRIARLTRNGRAVPLAARLRLDAGSRYTVEFA
jgi:hypothetical protein